MDLPSKLTCQRCLMRFDVRKPSVNGGKFPATFSRCSVPGCGRRMWEAQAREVVFVRVGMTPADERAWLGLPA